MKKLLFVSKKLREKLNELFKQSEKRDTGVPGRTLIYGQHGVGKTTMAAQWPEPILLPTEDGYHHVNVASGPKLKCY